MVCDVIQFHQDKDGHVDSGISEQPDLADTACLGGRREVSVCVMRKGWLQETWRSAM